MHFRCTLALKASLLLLILSPYCFADSIKLSNGDILHGEIVTEDAGGYVELKHSDLGLMRIQLDRVSEIVRDADQPVDEGLLGTGLLLGWERSLAIGLSGTEGNSNHIDAHVDFKSEYENGGTRRKLEVHYNSQIEDGETTENNLYAEFDNDTLYEDTRWFWFTRGRADWDEFNDWRYRIGGYVGPGYQHIKTSDLNIRSRMGIGGVKNWGGEAPDFVPELLLGLEAKWKINPQQSLSASNTLYPDLKDSGEFRNVAKLSWRIKLEDLYRGAALKMGLVDEYESRAAEDIKHNDLKYKLSLEFGL